MSLKKLFSLLCFSGFVSLLLGFNAAAQADTRPNIIFLLTDDQRFDSLGCMGNDVIKTPHIDQLAENGVVFDNMFCTTSICCMSRASMLTGQYARRHGIWSFRDILSEEAFSQTFPALMRKAGYRTAFVGKWGVGNQLPKDQYDHWAGFAGQGKYFEEGKPHMTRRIANDTMTFLDTCNGEKPFCLQVSFKVAHCQDGPGWQFRYAPEYEKHYAEDKVALPKTATEEHFQRLPKFLQESEARLRWYRRFDGEEMRVKNVKDYYRLITGVDDVVGEIVAKLEEKKLSDNTIIVYSSDQGFFLGEHGMAGKWYMHEESIRMPLVVFDPRLSKKNRGQRKDQKVLSIDLAPTFLDFAGIKKSEVMQGESLVALVNGSNDTLREEFFYEHLFEHAKIPKSEGVRTDRWKYVRYVEMEPVAEQLFDLKNDPLEEHDLATDETHAAQLSKMRKRCDIWTQLAK